MKVHLDGRTGWFDSAATSGFITVQAIRLRRYGSG